MSYPRGVLMMEHFYRGGRKNFLLGWGASSNIHIGFFFVLIGRPPWVDVQMANRLKIPHTFVIHTYTKPTKCHFCNKMLMGVIKQVRRVEEKCLTKIQSGVGTLFF